MHVTGDRRVCVGAGQCVLAAPDVFGQDEDHGLVLVLQGEPATTSVRPSTTRKPHARRAPCTWTDHGRSCARRRGRPRRGAGEDPRAAPRDVKNS
ncbi:ferredoxin [Streptomonospora halophila]|uniref:ferredoxin n=1 Tax=Streptomonospora halophila TaxID=427369 RepID=UPI0031E66E11